MRSLAPLAVVLGAAIALTACTPGTPPGPGPSPSQAPSTSTAFAVRVASLKGPTTMGMVSLMDQASRGGAQQPYTFTVSGTPDAVSGPLVAGDYDVALIPVNLAAVLYNKTNGGVKLAAVAVLGVLYVVTGDPGVKTLADLKGKTITNSGKGTTPQFVIDKVLANAGLANDVTVNYVSQPTEQASALNTTPTSIQVLPEPYVTAVMAKNPDVHVVADLSAEWQQAVGSPLVTACVAVRTAFATSTPDALAAFMTEYAASVKFVNEHPDQAAPLIVAQGLAPDAATAAAVIPRAHLVALTGADAKSAVSTYLSALYAADPASVGGKLPGDDFYYSA